ADLSEQVRDGRVALAERSIGIHERLLEHGLRLLGAPRFEERVPEAAAAREEADLVLAPELDHALEETDRVVEPALERVEGGEVVHRVREGGGFLRHGLLEARDGREQERSRLL